MQVLAIQPEFQFHNGLISRIPANRIEYKQERFQFHNGLISRPIPQSFPPLYTLFQFHNGLISSGNRRLDFQSCIVSIPQWSD